MQSVIQYSILTETLSMAILTDRYLAQSIKTDALAC